MKKIILFITVFYSQFNAHSQCGDPDIRTDPANPINNQFIPLVESNDGVPLNYTNNSFLNTFNWYPQPSAMYVNNIGPSNQPPLFDPAFSSSPTPAFYTMDNALWNSNPGNQYLRIGSGTQNYVPESEYHWNDGWELMYMNIGIFPNGDGVNGPSAGTFYNDYFQALIPTVDYNESPSPLTMPYFVLYNRYRGLLRVFYNYWDDNTSGTKKISVRLKILDPNNLNVDYNGTLRHANQYDQALDVPTTSANIVAPKTIDAQSDKWSIAEFQLGYDPCVCEFESNLKIEFQILDQLSIDLTGRSLAFTDNYDLTDIDNDFLGVNTSGRDVEAGYYVYQRMEDVFETYRTELDNYNQQLSDYNAQQNNLMRELLTRGKELAVDGALSVIPSATLAKFAIEKATRWGIDGLDSNSQKDVEEAIKAGSKNALGEGYDFLSAQLFGATEEPVKPTAPVATFEESVYSGSITDEYTLESDDLLVPGAITENSQVDPALLNSKSFPIYNKKTGLFALLETPEIYTVKTSEMSDDDYGFSFKASESVIPFQSGIGEGIEETWKTNFRRRYTNDFVFKLKNPLNYSINNHVDWDKEATEVKVMFEFEFTNGMDAADYQKSIDDGLDFDYAIAKSGRLIPNGQLKHLFPPSNSSSNSSTLIYSTNWVDIENAHNRTFQISNQIEIATLFDSIVRIFPDYPPANNSGTDFDPAVFDYLAEFEMDLSKVKMKIFADFEFEQTSAYTGEPVVSSQVFTYVLYNQSEGINQVEELTDVTAQVKRYDPGEIFLHDDLITPSHPAVYSTTGTVMYILAENVTIDGDITVENGYELVIEAVNSINVEQSSTLFDEPILLKANSDFFGVPASLPATSEELSSFCTGQENKYQAYVFSPGKRDPESSNSNDVIPPVAEDLRESTTQIQLYPNPVAQYFQLKNATSGAKFQIVSTMGSVVKVGNLNNSNSIDVSQLIPGVYFITIENQTLKFVKR